MATVDLVRVFTCEGKGGNPCPIVIDAEAMSPEDMQAVARKYRLESGFVRSPPSADFDYTFRFWVPNHEMEMCGHATIGALWVLASKGLASAAEVRISTRSGPVAGFISKDTNATQRIAITQPSGKVVSLNREQDEDVLRALGVSRSDLLDLPIQNAVTSRVKTLVPLKDVERVNALKPDTDAVGEACTKIGSTGLYPFSVIDRESQRFEARQFPRSSGYPEDAATGIAAAALAFGLLRSGLVRANADPIRIFQGRTMGHLSEIEVRLGFANDRALGCLLGGAVTPLEELPT